MKYLIGVACLAISLPSFALAQWSHFGTVLKDNDIYLDHKRFERLEQPTLWVLFDSKDPDEDGSRSVTQHYQADCKSNQVRTLEFEYFEGHMSG